MRILKRLTIILLLTLVIVYDNGCKSGDSVEEELKDVRVTYFEAVNGGKVEQVYPEVSTTNPVLISPAKAEELGIGDVNDRYMVVFDSSGPRVFKTVNGESYAVTEGGRSYVVFLLEGDDIDYSKVENPAQLHGVSHAFEYSLNRDGRTIDKSVIDDMVDEFNHIFDAYNSMVGSDRQVSFYHKSGADLLIGAGDAYGAMGVNSDTSIFVDTNRIHDLELIMRVLREEAWEFHTGVEDVANNGTSFTLITSSDGHFNRIGRAYAVAVEVLTLDRIR